MLFLQFLPNLSHPISYISTVFRSSGGKGIYNNWTAGKSRQKLPPPSPGFPPLKSVPHMGPEDNIGGGDMATAPAYKKAALYILGEKSQIKVRHRMRYAVPIHDCRNFYSVGSLGYQD